MKRIINKVRRPRDRAALLIILLTITTSHLDRTRAAATLTASQDGGSLTLKHALKLALDSNPDLQAAGDRVDATAGRAQQAGLWENPSLILNTEEWPLSGGGGFGNAKQTIGVSQTLPFPGKRGVDRQIGRASLQRSEIGLALRRRELIRDVTRAYCQALAAESLVEVAGNLVSMAESSASYARERVAAGAAADQEQLRAEISLEQARAELKGFKQQQLTAHQLLAQILGDPTAAERQLSGNLPETANLSCLDRSPETWLQQHPEWAAAEQDHKRAALNLKRASLQPYPDVTVGLAGGRLGDTSQSILELGITIPLPIIDTSKGYRQEAAANTRAAESGLLAAEIRLLTQWRSASARFRTAADQVDTYRDRILPKATEALRLVRTGFEEGKFGFIDLLDTQRTAAEVRLAYQNRLLELSLALAEIEYLAGPFILPETITLPSSMR